PESVRQLGGPHRRGDRVPRRGSFGDGHQVENAQRNGHGGISSLRVARGSRGASVALNPIAEAVYSLPPPLRAHPPCARKRRLRWKRWIPPPPTPPEPGRQTDMALPSIAALALRA